MKNSGIEWIGEIPDSWEYFRLKDYYIFEKGKNAAIYTQDYIGLHKGIYPVYSGQTENNGVMGCIDTFDYDLEECLFTTTVGAKVMTPKILRGKFSLSQNCLIMKKTKECNNSYIYYYLFPLFSYAKSLIPTYMQPSLRVADLNLYGFYVPNCETQYKIAKCLNEKCGKIDELIANQQGQIEKLKEYKQSVITEAVTKGLNKSAPLKDSGNDYIGNIPKHWESIKIKYICSMQAGKNLISEQISPMGDYPVYGGNGLRGYFGEYNYEGVCLLVGRQGALCGNVHHVEGKFWATEHAVITKPKTGVYLRYLFYLLIGANLNLYVSPTAAQPGLSVNSVQNIILCKAPIKEQQQIVDYLDEKCGKIDRLIAIKQEKIEKLQEYKKSLIYEYVTGKKEVC